MMKASEFFLVAAAVVLMVFACYLAATPASAGYVACPSIPDLRPGCP
jgi:hypothetical protein